MSQILHGHMCPLETWRRAKDEVTSVRFLRQWRSLPTWKWRTRSGATTQTTRHHLHGRSTTNLSSTRTTAQTNTRVPSQNPALPDSPLHPARKSATANQTKKVTTTEWRRKGTGTKSGSGGRSSRHRRPIRWGGK